MMGPAEIARAAWGADIPEWVERLAFECAATSQNKVAKRIKRSAAMISQVLRRKYPGDLSAVEELINGVFMAKIIECPALGNIPANECQDWRRKSGQFINVNALRVRMFRACSGCSRNLKGGK